MSVWSVVVRIGHPPSMFHAACFVPKISYLRARFSASFAVGQLEHWRLFIAAGLLFRPCNALRLLCLGALRVKGLLCSLRPSENPPNGTGCPSVSFQLVFLEWVECKSHVYPCSFYIHEKHIHTLREVIGISQRSRHHHHLPLPVRKGGLRQS